MDSFSYVRLSLTSESILSKNSVLSMITVTRPLSAGSITMSSSFCSRLSALCSFLVKLLSSFVEATLLQMLSLQARVDLFDEKAHLQHSLQSFQSVCVWV